MKDPLNAKVDELPTDPLTPKDAPPTLDTSKLDGQIYAFLKHEIQRGMKKQTPWWERGKAMRDFCDGIQWEADLLKLITPENGWIRKNVNKMKALRTGLMSQIAFQEARVNALATRRNPDFIGKANVANTLMNHSIKECGMDTAQKKAALDAIHFGAGPLRLCTSPEKGGIPCAEWVSMEDVVFDPDAKTLEDAQWVAYRFRANIFAARGEYDAPTLRSDKQASVDAKVEQKTDEMAPAPEAERVEIWEVWCRADAIAFADAKESSARNAVKDLLPEDSPAALKYMTESGNRVFHICLTHPTILSDEPWPFIIDHDMLPIWLVYLEESTSDLLPESVLVPAMGLQRAMNTMLTFIVTQAYVTARIKFTADKATVADPQVQKGLKSAEVGTIIGTDGGQLPIAPLQLGGLNMAMIQAFDRILSLFDQITGYAEMFGGMAGTRSAAEAVIREDRAQTNSSSMRVSFERGLKRVLRGMWQIAMSTLKHQKVSRIVGYEEMGYVDETGTINADPRKNVTPINWPYDQATPEDIRCENFIEYVVNSTRRSNPQQDVQDLNQFLQTLLGVTGAYTQQGYRINPTRMARKYNYITTQILQSMGRPDYKQMEMTPEDLSIDDRLMPRGPTEEQMIAKLQEKQAKEGQEKDAGNVDGISAFFEAHGANPEMVQGAIAGLSPEMRAALVQAIEQGAGA